MYKNKTLLLKLFQTGRPSKPIFQYLSPLFYMKVHRLNKDVPLKEMLNNYKMNYTPHKTDFDRILILHSGQDSNARRSVFINRIRSEIIEFINHKGQPHKLYVINLSQINHFVPKHFLLTHLQRVLNSLYEPSGKKLDSQEKLKSKQKNGQIIKSNADRLKELQELIMAPNLNVERWKQFLEANFSKKSRLNNFSMDDSYLNLQIFSIYMCNFATNPFYLYQDLKDFSLMLQKFNFIRYFWDVSLQNQFMARKHCERLIKTIKWRSNQSEQYLLILVRMHNWQRFFLALQDFCLTYQKLQLK